MEQPKYDQKLNSAQQVADPKPTPHGSFVEKKIDVRADVEKKIDVRTDDKAGSNNMLNEGGNQIQQKATSIPPNVNNDKQRQTVAALEQGPHDETKNRNDDASSGTNKPQQDQNPAKASSDQAAPASGTVSAGPDGKKVFTR